MPVFECTVEDVTFRNEENGWAVIRVKLDDKKDRFAAVGVMPLIASGEHVRLTGEWDEHRDFGRQLKVSLCESVAPTTRSGIEKYLASGLVKGVGPSTAKLLVQQFGVDTLRVLTDEPERLTEVDGIGPKRARQIAESFHEQLETRTTMMFLQKYDISPALAVKIYKRYGEATQQVMQSNPYRLVDEIVGVGFRTADRIALSMGFPAESEMRLTVGVKYVLSEAGAASGHMYLPREILLEQAARLLGADEALIERAMRQLLLTRQLVETPIEDYTAVYLASFYDAEAQVARRLTELSASCDAAMDEAAAEAEITRYEREEGVRLCAEQRQGVIAAVTGGLTIITGGPGTGKTTGIKCIIELMSRRGEVLLTAPTGRAAKRMSEATGCPAKTIHRLLEFSGDEGCFARDEDNPLECDMVIVDEMSMVDIFLMKSLLLALPAGTRLVMVGDADQLPSVGAGNVLGDLIASGVLPVIRLNEIFRQEGGSMIVQNAHRINRGELPILNGKNTDFFIERRDSQAAAIDSILQLVSRRLPGYMNLDPIRDIQVLSPTKKTDLGVWNLNRLLQQTLNPPAYGKNERTRGETLFRLGDKVMQTRNDYQLEWKRDLENGVGVFNGDMGFITGVDEDGGDVEVTFDDERVAVYDDGNLDELELAYCISVHKSQGSEFPAVVLPVWSWPPMLMTRNLFYTAVTRARRLAVLVGREGCVAQMVQNNRIYTRYSDLQRRLQEADALRAK